MIICSSDFLTSDHVEKLAPKILTFDPDNGIVERLSYHVDRTDTGLLSFSILVNGKQLPVPLREDYLATKPKS